MGPGHKAQDDSGGVARFRTPISDIRAGIETCDSGYESFTIGSHGMVLTVETELETDGRWIAEVPELPGVLAYGATEDEAAAKAEALALRVLADRLDHGLTDDQL